MNNYLKAALAVALLCAGIAFADRVVTLSTARSKVTRVDAISRPDGGCAARACGELNDSAGNFVRQSCSNFTDLDAAARTRCLNIINSGETLWRQHEGL
jgi:uncharacterized NAD(P)/FAD-binding protein YdhS